MRIALVSPYSWSVPGGVNIHIRDLADELRHRGHEVRVLGVAEGAVPGIVRLGRTTPVPINAGVARIAISPLLAGRVRVALRRARPDVVHVHEPFVSTVSLAAVLAARGPVVATFHSGAETSAYRTLRPLLQPVWNRITVRLAVSNAARSLVEDAFGPGARIVPNGVELARFASVPPAPVDHRVLFFGRLERRKGPQVLADAWPKVVAAVPDAKLTIAGQGRLQSSLEAALDGYDVTFTRAAYDHEQLRDLLAAADVACLPAIGGESFGITLIEAMAARRALVATAVAGYTSVVRGDREGVLVPPEDPDALATALVSVLTNPGLRDALAAGGGQRAERFGWDRVAGEVEEAYRDALAPARNAAT